MKALLFVLLSGMCIAAVAQIPSDQNLVPNPYFAEISSCPAERGQINVALHWESPNGGGVEVYNRCAAGGQAGVPNNFSGFQQPFMRDGYAGVRTWREGGLYREYLYAQLHEPLKAGETYLLSFWASPGDSIAYISDDLGMSLSTIEPTAYELMPFMPLIENPEGELINNFDNWRQISGQYVAKGGEQHLLIGNFKDEASTTRIRHSDNPELHESVYLYIDAVEVIPWS